MFDRDALEELFEYTDFTWAAFGRALRNLPADAFTRQIDGSGWGSLRRALIHIALAWDGWAYERTGAGPLPELTDEDVPDWETLQPHRQRVRALLRQALDETNDDVLTARVLPMWGDTPAAHHVSVTDVLAHILLHERGHHGDISTLFAQLGAEPPNVDYLVYRFFKSRRQTRDG